MIKSIKGRAVPKPENGQNTDDILPAKFLKEITFSNIGNYLYYYERFRDETPVPDHPFNKQEYKGAKILIAGANYGCGSSREHAPQALSRYGIEAIVAESFAEIFAGNCASLGVVGVAVSHDDIIRLTQQVRQAPETEFDIDLERKSISFDGETIDFELPEGRRQAFLKGTWDALTVLQKNDDRINEVESRLSYLQFK